MHTRIYEYIIGLNPTSMIEQINVINETKKYMHSPNDIFLIFTVYLLLYH